MLLKLFDCKIYFATEIFYFQELLSQFHFVVALLIEKQRSKNVKNEFIIPAF